MSGPGVISVFNKAINGLFKVCREIRGPQKSITKSMRDMSSGFNLYAQCYKITYKEDESQVLTYHLPLFEELLEKLKDVFVDFNPEDDSWIRGKDLRIVYGSNRGEKSKKIAIRVSEFYEVALKKDKEIGEESDLSGDFLTALLKVLNTCPNRRELKLEGSLLVALNEFDEYEDTSEISSDDENDMARQVDRTISQIDNPELINRVGGTIGNIMKGLNLPMPTANPPNTEPSNSKKKSPFFE